MSGRNSRLLFYLYVYCIVSVILLLHPAALNHGVYFLTSLQLFLILHMFFGWRLPLRWRRYKPLQMHPMQIAYKHLVFRNHGSALMHPASIKGLSPVLPYACEAVFLLLSARLCCHTFLCLSAVRKVFRKGFFRRHRLLLKRKRHLPDKRPYLHQEFLPAGKRLIPLAVYKRKRILLFSFHADCCWRNIEKRCHLSFPREIVL